MNVAGRIHSQTSGIFCCRLKAFANNLDPDKVQHNVSPDLVPSRLILYVSERKY